MKVFIPAIVLFLLGFILIILGTLFKIQHWPYGGELLTLGMFIKVIAAFYTIVMLLKKYRKMN